MRILFAIQGEGRGHFTQALTLRAALEAEGHTVVGAMVGCSRARRLPEFFLRRFGTASLVRYESPNFSPTDRRVDLPRSIAYNMRRIPRYAKSLRKIRKTIRTLRPDAVVNFYELLTGIAYGLYHFRAPMICIAHQYYFMHRDVNPIGVDRSQVVMLNMFSRATSLGAACRLALSMRPMADDPANRITIVPPLLRREVLTADVSRGNYVLAYMLNAGFTADIERFHRRRPDIPLRVFRDKPQKSPVRQVDATLQYHTIDDRRFILSMASCRAYATTAGFESVCEAMYMGKPVVMVPSHLEQQCNAADAQAAGAGIACDHFDIDRLLAFSDQYKPNPAFARWARSAGRIIVGLIEQTAGGVATQRRSAS